MSTLTGGHRRAIYDVLIYKQRVTVIRFQVDYPRYTVTMDQLDKSVYVDRTESRRTVRLLEVLDDPNTAFQKIVDCIEGDSL